MVKGDKPLAAPQPPGATIPGRQGSRSTACGTALTISDWRQLQDGVQGASQVRHFL